MIQRNPMIQHRIMGSTKTIFVDGYYPAELPVDIHHWMNDANWQTSFWRDETSNLWGFWTVKLHTIPWTWGHGPQELLFFVGIFPAATSSLRCSGGSSSLWTTKERSRGWFSLKRVLKGTIRCKPANLESGTACTGKEVCGHLLA